MPIELSPGWIIALNIVGWPVIQLGVGWVFTRIQVSVFSVDLSWLRPGEREAKLYENLLGIRRWKHLLPDGGPWVRGFAKANLRSKDPQYMRAFVAETRRGECAHWVMMLFGGIFFLWNPVWADLVMASYALAGNLPCIITQRYNRVRLRRIVLNAPA